MGVRRKAAGKFSWLRFKFLTVWTMNVGGGSAMEDCKTTSHNERTEPVRALPTSVHVHGKKWGPWRYDARLLTLTHTERRYEVDLEQCNTSAEILDWLCQVSHKVWCTREDTGYLLQAIDDLLDPQAHVGSNGVEQVGFSTRAYLLKAMGT
jgi:hypothetical protein